jgi:hypothetical protein
VALPTVVGVGAATSGAAGITPAYPGGYTATADDLGFTWVECLNTDTVTPPTGWALATSTTVTSGTAPTKLSVLWRRIQGGDTAPPIADAGDHMVGRMIVIRGGIVSGNPWELITGTSELVSDTTVSIPGGITTVPDQLVMVAFGTGQDVASTAGATGWTNASLASLTERMDGWAIAGSGGGFAMATGEKAAAGTVDATTATLSLTANFKTLIIISVKPPGPVAGPPAKRGYQGYPYLVVQ